jgi:hypothetical protein
VAPAPVPFLAPAEPFPEEEARTRRLVALIEQHTGMPPEALAQALLLPAAYRPDREEHDAWPSVATQLWLEGRTGEAAFSEAQRKQVLARARRLYDFEEPPETAEAAAQRASRWERLAEDMRRSHVPLQIVLALNAVQPGSREELTHMIKRGRLRPLHLTAGQLADLHGWLRLPREREPAPTPRQRMHDFMQEARAWEKRACPTEPS